MKNSAGVAYVRESVFHAVVAPHRGMTTRNETPYIRRSIMTESMERIALSFRNTHDSCSRGAMGR